MIRKEESRLSSLRHTQLISGGWSECRDVTFEVDDTEHILNDAPVTPRGAASALAKVPGFDREELWSYGVIMYQVRHLA